MTWQDWLVSKTFWGGVGLAALAVYQATQQHFDQAAQSVAAALIAWGVRHALDKGPTLQP